jgi:hypothetical protein
LGGECDNIVCIPEINDLVLIFVRLGRRKDNIEKWGAESKAGNVI